MEYDQLIQKIEAMHRRLATLGQPAGGSAAQDAARLDVQQDLASALEELHEASEELHRQNEELIATRQAVEAERQRYQDLFNFAPDGYLVTDPEGIVQEANRAAAAALNVDQDFLLGKPLLVFVAEEDQKTFHARLAQLRADVGTEQGWEIDLQPRHGTPFRACMTVSKVCDMASQVIGIRWLLRDITERKRAAEALRESEERYRSLFRNMLDGFAYCKMLFDDQGRPIDFICLEVNSAFGRLTGLENVVGRRVTEVIPGIRESHPELFERYGRVALTGQPETFEFEFKPLGAWLSVSAYCPEREYFVAVFENITGRKQAEEKVSWLASFPELNPDPVMEVDWAGLVQYANPTTIRIAPDIRDVDTRHPLLADLPSALAKLEQGGDGQFSREVKAGDISYQQSFFHVPGSQRIRIYALEITDRKRVEEKLQAVNERLCAILSSITDAYFCLDAEWRFVEINLVAAQILFQRPYGELLGKVFWEEYPQVIDSEFYRQYQLAVAEGRPVHFEARSRIVDGWFEVHAYPREGRLEVYGREITGRKRAEEERERLLQELETEKTRWQATVENMLDPVATCDAGGRLTYGNPAYTRMLGRQIEEGLDPGQPSSYQLYRSDGRLFDPLDLPLQRAALRGEEVRNVVVVQRSAGGEERIGIWNAAPLRDVEGDIAGAVAVGRDITAQCQAEAQRERLSDQVAEERDRLQALIHSIADEVWFCDVNGNVSLLNTAAADGLGLDRAGESPRTLAALISGLEICTPDGRPRAEVDAPLIRSLQGETLVGVEEIVRHLRTGQMRHRLVSSAPIRTREGRIAGAVAVAHDITYRKQAEEVLTRYQVLAERARDIVLFVGRDGRILEANQAAAAAYGYPREELLALTIQDLRAPETRALTAQQMAQADTEGILFETIHRRKDGTQLPVEVSSRGTTLGGERVLLSIVRDITERKRDESALREGGERLRMALRAANAGIWEWNLLTGKVRWSDEYYGLLGVAAGAIEPSYEAWVQTLHPDDREITEGLVRRATNLKENVDIEYRIIRPDGNIRWLNSRGHSFYDEDGRPIRMLGIAIDVTQRKRAEESLLSARETLEGQLRLRTAELTGASRRLGVELTRHERTEEEIRRLGETLERRASELVALDRIGRALTSSLDPEAVLWLLVNEVRGLLGTGGAAVWQHDPRSDELVFVAAEGAGLEWLKGQRVPTTDSIVGWVFHNQQATLVDDVRNDPRFYGHLFGQSEIPLRSLIAVPLISRGAVIGVLGTIDKIDGVFSEDDLQSLTAIANAAAVAIENARLYAAEQGRRRRLEAVRAVTEEITRELELAKVLEIIVRRAAELLGVGTGTVWLWDERAQVLVSRARLHPGEDVLAGRTLRLGEGTAGVVAERKHGLIVNEYPTWPHALPALVDRGTVTAAMGEPLMYGDRCLGVLVVNNAGTGRTFSQEDGQLLALFASHAAIAIENARLFEEVQAGRRRVENLSRKLVEIQETERRHIARELHDEIGQSLTGLKLLLDMNARVSPKQARENQGDAQAIVNDLLSQVRDLSLELRPAMLDDLGLLAALVWHFERYRTRTNVQVTFKHVGMEGRRFPTEVETAAYRIVQEALTNVARYAQVQAVTVRLWAGEELLGMQIEDRGVGFDPAVALAAHISSGLAGMRERAGLLGGRMAIESAPGAGTRVAAEFPLGGMNRGVKEKVGG